MTRESAWQRRVVRGIQFAAAMAIILCPGVGLMAQGTSSGGRIVGPVDDNRRVVLVGNTHPAARAQYDRGRASRDLSMGDMILVLKRSPEQQAAFDAFVASQYDKGSPNFHHWLTAREVGERYGPAASDITLISNWLRKHGLSVNEVSNDRMFIRFSGTVAQVESAFHTTIHNLEVNGEEHFANMSDPQIPSALAPVVAGIKALHNFFPRPMHQMGSRVILNGDRSQWQRVPRDSDDATKGAASLAGILPLFYNASTGAEDITPYDFATIYNVLPVWTGGINGSGETIAIAGRSNIIPSDIATFRETFGLPSNPPTVIITNSDPGTGNSDDLEENTVDVEWSGAVAPAASVVLVASTSEGATGGDFISATYVVESMSPTPGIMSYSYGECELGLGNAGNSAYNDLWQSATSEGMAVFVASGDSGSAMCDQGNTAPYFAVYGLSVNGDASTPYNTAVGGTDLNWLPDPSQFWGSTNNATTGANALGYIPEVPWNQSCLNPIFISTINSSNGLSLTGPEMCYDIASKTLASNNATVEAYLISTVNASGGGGGASDCTTSTGTTCSSGYGKPSWQAGVPGIPADNARDLPDISFFASDEMLGSGYLMVVNSETDEVGGTSVASPAMAGVMALINQKAGGSQGNPNVELYGLAGQQNYSVCSAELVTTFSSCYFNDIDTGTNSVPCNSTTGLNCVDNYQGVGELSGWPGASGYDLATGLGSLNVAKVVDAWPVTTLVGWQQVPGSLAQISVGSDGSIWGINGAGQIYMFNPQTQTWQAVKGALTQIAVGSSGYVWGLNAAGQIYRYDAVNQTWDQIPGILSQIAVGSDGDVWGINASAEVYHFNSALQTWVQIPGAMAQIAVGYDGAIWGLNAAQQIYRFNPGTQSWQQIPGALKQIAVGADGDVWGINSGGQAYHFNSLRQQWDNPSANLAQIAVGSGSNVWGLDSASNIWHFNPQAQAWDLVPGQLSQIAAAANGAVWGLGSAEQIYQFIQPTQATQTFHQAPGALAQISVGIDGVVWGLDATQHIWRYDPQRLTWEQIPGALSQLCVGFGGNVWGLNAGGQIWQYNPSSGWQQIAGSLSQLAVSADGSAWGLDTLGRIWRYNPSTQSMQQIPGLLAQLAVGADGTVWGINSADQIWSFNPSTQNWNAIPGSLAQIAVGSAGQVWGINAAGQIYRYDQQLQTWDSIPGLLASLAVAFDGTVWGLNSANQVWRFDTQTQNWDSIPGLLSQVNVAADAVIWGLNASSQIFTYW